MFVQRKFGMKKYKLNGMKNIKRENFMDWFQKNE